MRPIVSTVVSPSDGKVMNLVTDAGTAEAFLLSVPVLEVSTQLVRAGI